MCTEDKKDANHSCRESQRSINLRLGTGWSTCPPYVNEQLSSVSAAGGGEGGKDSHTATALTPHLEFTEIIIHLVCNMNIRLPTT